MDYLKEIIDSINETVLVVDENYKIQFCSGQVKNLTGKSPEKLTGKKCHLVLFNSIEPCKGCQLEEIKNGKFAKDIEHDTITHRGFRKLLSASFLRLPGGLFAEVLEDITSTKKLIDKLTHQTKELKASNIMLKLRSQDTDKKHRFIKSTLNSLAEGVMVVNEDYTINVSNSSIRELNQTLKEKDLDSVKCYEMYGYSEPCEACPFKDDKLTKTAREVFERKLTVSFNKFDRYVVESFRDTTKEFKMVSEIRVQQENLKEKQRQMTLLNDDLLRMNEKLKEAHAIIDGELTQVGQIQESLLPKELPQIEGYDFGAYYTPAEHAGGDYYDSIEMSNNYWGLGVADVSGHGIPASVIMAITRAIMRSYTYDIISSSEALFMVNEILCDNIHTNDFVTMFYMVLDAKNSSMNFASAGHNPLLLYDKSEMVVKKITAQGMFLGAFEGVDYEEGTLEIDNGDVVFMYTDGLNEAMNAEREQYGYDRLISKIMMFSELPVPEMISNIMDDVKSFTKGIPFEDDITILAFKKL